MLLKYSNGWGHVVMSIFFALIGLALIVVPTTDGTTKGIGIGLIGTVSSAWFIPNAAKQVIYQLKAQGTVQSDGTIEEAKANATDKKPNS